MVRTKKIFLRLVLISFLMLPGNSYGFSEEGALQHTPTLKARQFLEKVKPLVSHDIMNVLTAAEEAVTDEATPENLNQLWLVLDYYYTLENKEKMKIYSDRLENIARLLHRSDILRRVAVYRVYALSLDGDYDRAIHDLEDQLKVALIQKDNTTTVIIYDALASLYPTKGEYYMALNYAEKAIGLLKNTPLERRLRLHLYNTLTYLYTELEDFEKTFEFANLSLDIVAQTGLYMDISTVIYNVGLVIQDKGYYDISRLYFKELLDFYKKTNQPEMIIYPYYAMALNAYQQDKTLQSLDYIKKGLEYEATSKNFAASLWQLAAEQYAMLGQIEEAKLYREKINVFFKANPSYQDSRWENINQRIDAKIAYAEGHYQEAYKIFNRFHKSDLAKSEGEFSRDVLKLRAGLEATMRVEKAEQEILNERNELKLQRLMFLIIGFLLLLVIIVGAYFLQRRTVIALDISKREAEAANRIKTEFLANMSHELRTPLNAIIGFSEMMIARIYGSIGHENYGQYAEMINSSGQHLLNIITEILDMSKVESGALELNELQCDLIVTVKAATRIFSDRQNDLNVTIHITAPDDLPDLTADLRILNQILYNALSNAMKFNKQNGRIDVCLSQIAQTGALQITISDNGIGMSAENLAHVMKPFAQVQNSLTRNHEGTGLGLPLIMAFMKLHGGTLDVASEEAIGTTLTMIFPPERTLETRKLKSA